MSMVTSRLHNFNGNSPVLDFGGKQIALSECFKNKTTEWCSSFVELLNYLPKPVI